MEAQELFTSRVPISHGLYFYFFIYSFYFIHVTYIYKIKIYQNQIEWNEFYTIFNIRYKNDCPDIL